MEDRAAPDFRRERHRHDIAGTFYILGDTAERHMDTCKAIVAAGHDVGHHGHLHLRSDEIDAGTAEVLDWSEVREQIAQRRARRSGP